MIYVLPTCLPRLLHVSNWRGWSFFPAVFSMPPRLFNGVTKCKTIQNILIRIKTFLNFQIEERSGSFCLRLSRNGREAISVIVKKCTDIFRLKRIKPFAIGGAVKMWLRAFRSYAPRLSSRKNTKRNIGR